MDEFLDWLHPMEDMDYRQVDYHKVNLSNQGLLANDVNVDDGLIF